MEPVIIPRIFDKALLASFGSGLITVVLGPRQTGKTTSVNLLLKDIPAGNKFTLNLDSSFIREKVIANEGYCHKPYHCPKIYRYLAREFNRFFTSSILH